MLLIQMLLKNYLKLERQIVLDNIEFDSILNDNETKTFFQAEETYYRGGLYKEACKHRTNRYSTFGSVVSRTSVKFAWAGISFGEIRDLNRHRTGTKYCPLLPIGFYGASDQIPNKENTNIKLAASIYSLYEDFKYTTNQAREILKDHPEYIYFTSLGHKYYFEQNY